MAKKSIFREYFEKIPKPFRNKYILTGIAFCGWMLFFDRHDLFTQLHLQNTLEDMKEKNAHYVEKVEEVNSASENLSENNDAKERFAREEYFMKKDDEEVFVIKIEE